MLLLLAVGVGFEKRPVHPTGGPMARGIETGWGSWAVLALLLVSSSVVLVLEWNKVRDHTAL